MVHMPSWLAPGRLSEKNCRPNNSFRQLRQLSASRLLQQEALPAPTQQLQCGDRAHQRLWGIGARQRLWGVRAHQRLWGARSHQRHRGDRGARQVLGISGRAHFWWIIGRTCGRWERSSAEVRTNLEQRGKSREKLCCIIYRYYFCLLHLRKLCTAKKKPQYSGILSWHKLFYWMSSLFLYFPEV